MIKVSRLADYAVVVLVSLSSCEEDVVAAGCLSDRTSLPEPTVSKVLKLLAKGGVLESVRGAGGGYVMTRAPDTITVEQIIAAIDGPVNLTACMENGDTNGCDYAKRCSVKGRWLQVNNAVVAALQNITLCDMTGLQKQDVKG